MTNIVETQLEQEAKNIIQFDSKGMKCGGNALKRECNCYGMTLKYLFAVKELSYKQVGEILGISSQGVNHLVNRTKERNFQNNVFVRKICTKLGIDYLYFYDLSSKVKELM